MLIENMNDFFNLRDFAIEVQFTNGGIFVVLDGIFDVEGTVSQGVVLDSARFMSTRSEVSVGWECEIADHRYSVIQVLGGNGNFCEYLMRDITESRDIL